MEPAIRQRTFFDMINSVFSKNPDLKVVPRTETDKKINSVCRSPKHDALSDLEPEWSK